MTIRKSKFPSRSKTKNSFTNRSVVKRFSRSEQVQKATVDKYIHLRERVIGREMTSSERKEVETQFREMLTRLKSDNVPLYRNTDITQLKALPVVGNTVIFANDYSELFAGSSFTLDRDYVSNNINRDGAIVSIEDSTDFHRENIPLQLNKLTDKDLQLFPEIIPIVGGFPYGSKVDDIMEILEYIEDSYGDASVDSIKQDIDKLYPDARDFDKEQTVNVLSRVQQDIDKHGVSRREYYTMNRERKIPYLYPEGSNPAPLLNMSHALFLAQSSGENEVITILSTEVRQDEMVITVSNEQNKNTLQKKFPQTTIKVASSFN